jgi:membrane-bound ClpP family serine protease
VLPRRSILFLFGLLALFGQLFRGFDLWGTFWPFLIIGCGALFFVAMFLSGKSAAWLAIPGSIIIVTGLILLAQNLTGYWESWSYAWTLIVIAVGLGNFTTTVEGTPVTGIAYVDLRGTLKQDKSNDLFSIALNGKVGGRI